MGLRYLGDRFYASRRNRIREHLVWVMPEDRFEDGQYWGLFNLEKFDKNEIGMILESEGGGAFP